MEKPKHWLFTAIIFSARLLFPQTHQNDLWQNGTGAYNNYRIPSLIVTPAGTLLAFCEGREAGDAGDIDLLVKRSEDNGRTWSPDQVVWDDRDNTCGNPCPVIDRQTGRVWLFMTWNLGSDDERKIIRKVGADTRRPFLCRSDDDGKTWSTPVDMTATCKDPQWGWYATGPGIAVQLSSPQYKNRLVIPANHSYDDANGAVAGGAFGYGAHVLLSDDGGLSWRMSRPIRPGCNESQIVELSDGSLLMNMRSYNDQNCRAIATSHDGGETWSAVRHDQQLVESRCQAALLDYGLYQGKRMYLFSNPAVPNGRTHMTVKASFDDCQTWANSKLVHAPASAYSCLAKLASGDIGLLFECGDEINYDKIRFLSFSPAQLFTAGGLSE